MPKIVAKEADLVTVLNKHGFAFLPAENLFVLQSHELIRKLFAHGEFQKDELSYLTNQLTESTIISTGKHKA